MSTYASDSGASNPVREKYWLTTGRVGDTAKRVQSIVWLLGWEGGLCWYQAWSTRTYSAVLSTLRNYEYKYSNLL